MKIEEITAVKLTETYAEDHEEMKDFLQDKEFIKALYPDLNMTIESLPTKAERPFGLLRDGFRSREHYVKDVGFALFSKEFAQELDKVLTDLGIKTFVEIDAGSGSMTLMLDSMGYQGTAYTFEPLDSKHNWGIKKDNRFTKHALKMGLLKYQDIRDLVLDYKPDLMVASWIPYEGGDEVLEFVRVNPNTDPEYFLLIGEGWGGCTANDKFFEWLEENYEVVKRLDSYEPFIAIYDDAVIYKRKPHVVHYDRKKEKHE